MITRNIIVFDTETTGLDPDSGAEIVQLAATTIDYRDLSKHHIGNFNMYIKPERPEKASKGALDVIGDVWRKACDSGVDKKFALQKFAEYVESANPKKSSGNSRPILLAHNLPFDMKFLNYELKEKKLPTFKSYHNGLDSITLFYFLFESQPDFDRLSLDSVLESMGEKRKFGYHDALEDVELLSNAIIRSMRFLRECSKRMKIAR